MENWGGIPDSFSRCVECGFWVGEDLVQRAIRRPGPSKECVCVRCEPY